MARVFGIDFFSVLSRGSQYRVEGVMLRLTKPRNFIPVSPSREQVNFKFFVFYTKRLQNNLQLNVFHL